MIDGRNIDITTDVDNQKIVVINDIIFKGKRKIDWESVQLQCNSVSASIPPSEQLKSLLKEYSDVFSAPSPNDRIKNFSYLCGLCITKLTITDMPKMKTNAAAKKRFSFTGTGKIKRKHAYHSHILTKKTTKQKRNLCYSGTVSAADEAKIKNLLVK